MTVICLPPIVKVNGDLPLAARSLARALVQKFGRGPSEVFAAALTKAITEEST